MSLALRKYFDKLKDSNNFCRNYYSYLNIIYIK